MKTAEASIKARPKPLAKDKLIGDLKAVVTDMEDLLKATADHTGDKIAAIRNRAEESMKSAKAQLAEARSSVMDNAKAGVKLTDDYVRANSWKAVGVAGVVGLVVGVLFSRR